MDRLSPAPDAGMKSRKRRSVVPSCHNLKRSIVKIIKELKE